MNWWDYFSVIFVIILVCFLAYVFVRYGLRPMARPSGEGSIKIRERIPLDPRGSSMLLLVQIGGEMLLLGATQGGISLIKEISSEELDQWEKLRREEKEESPGHFANILKNFYRRKEDR